MSAPDQRNIREAGFDVPVSTEWQSVDKFVADGAPLLTPDPAAVELRLNPALPYHRVFLHLEPRLNSSGLDYWVGGQLRFTRNNRPVAVLPASVGQDTLAAGANGVKESGASVAVSSNVPVENCIKVSLRFWFASASTEAILIPTRVFAAADRVVYEVKDVRHLATNVAAMRVYLAVLSSNVNT